MDEMAVQLKISLKNSKPPIWRRVLVKSSISFYELHYTIQIAMGWGNFHLYEFKIGNYRIGIIDEDFDDPLSVSSDVIDATEITLDEVLSKGEVKSFTYEYDFGDGWIHSIVVEKTLPLDRDTYYPVCIKGKLACPPEDCGGLYGYYNLLEIISNKKHPEYEDMLEWMGGRFDPIEFEVEDVNVDLEDIEGIMGGEDEDFDGDFDDDFL
ncbi:plasmid pRiA4b ORF-3 family protein [Gillisia sp. Q332]|uniref:plasmid pRiA4b ORF-3 family protein n=1 Tax=Gillisia xinjiangensis TaxID=3384765 RepID=UPI00391D03A5